ncbi:MAG TPA: hypothetical protein VKU38_23610 [Ktedonobacteraceae bacterium]|nr:hypothetical protein [Ktedonobacteraceae bacterium]
MGAINRAPTRLRACRGPIDRAHRDERSNVESHSQIISLMGFSTHLTMT